MKRAFLLITIAFTFWSCSTVTDKDIAKSNIEHYLSMNLHDWSSYEFVSIGDINTTLKKDFYKQQYDAIEKVYNKKMDTMVNAIKKSEEMINSLKKQGMTVMADQVEANKNDMENWIEKTESKLKLYDSLYNASKEGEIYDKNVIFSFRANNAIGAKTLHDINVYMDEQLNVNQVENIN